jgi:hypothetical protein
VCRADGAADAETAAARKKADLLENVFERRCVVVVETE